MTWTPAPMLRTTLFALAWAVGCAQSSAHSTRPAAPDLPELLQSEGVFCARQTPRTPRLCEFVLHITRIESQRLWVSYMSFVRAKDGLPDVKLRVGHPATLVNGEICIAPRSASVEIELFEAKDSQPRVRADEKHLRSKSEELKATLQLDEAHAMTCRGLTRSGHLLTFGSPPTVLRFVPAAATESLRLQPEKRGL